jgi:hypothetical protein
MNSSNNQLLQQAKNGDMKTLKQLINIAYSKQGISVASASIEKGVLNIQLRSIKGDSIDNSIIRAIQTNAIKLNIESVKDVEITQYQIPIHEKINKSEDRRLSFVKIGLLVSTFFILIFTISFIFKFGSRRESQAIDTLVDVQVTQTPQNEQINTSQKVVDPLYFDQAISIATEAERLNNLALKREISDLKVTVEKWEQAANLMEQVQEGQKNYKLAPDKALEYSRNAQVIQKELVESGEAFLIKYLDDVTETGSSGTAMWCKSSEAVITSLFSPRNYEVLSTLPGDNSFFATVRIESSNRGGSSIIKDWDFAIHKDQAMINSPTFYGWCITLISD